jgi:hypothetical protein
VEQRQIPEQADRRGSRGRDPKHRRDEHVDPARAAVREHAESCARGHEQIEVADRHARADERRALRHRGGEVAGDPALERLVPAVEGPVDGFACASVGVEPGWSTAYRSRLEQAPWTRRTVHAGHDPGLGASMRVCRQIVRMRS